jgi:hypothetical protein
MNMLNEGMTEENWFATFPEEDLRRFVYRASEKVPGSVYEPFLHDNDWKAAGLSLLFTAGKVPVHTDSEELPRWAYLGVLLNDGYVVKHGESRAQGHPWQFIGSIIELNIHEPHALARHYACAPELTIDYPGFAALVFNSH